MDIERLKELRTALTDVLAHSRSRADLLELIDETIARQSVKSEDVAEGD